MARPPAASDLETKREALFSGALRHARSATLAASLVPVALVVAQPTTAYAQCVGSAEPPCPTVPEPATLLLLGPAAAAIVLRQRQKAKNTKK